MMVAVTFIIAICRFGAWGRVLYSAVMSEQQNDHPGQVPAGQGRGLRSGVLSLSCRRVPD